MMNEEWRILPYHEEKFGGRVLNRCHWREEKGNDHDHCAFCWDKFAKYDDCLHVGYCTEDGQEWICDVCYDDFKDRFGWRVKT